MKQYKTDKKKSRLLGNWYVNRYRPLKKELGSDGMALLNSVVLASDWIPTVINISVDNNWSYARTDKTLYWGVWKLMEGIADGSKMTDNIKEIYEAIQTA